MLRYSRVATISLTPEFRDFFPCKNRNDRDNLAERQSRCKINARKCENNARSDNLAGTRRQSYLAIISLTSIAKISRACGEADEEADGNPSEKNSDVESGVESVREYFE